MNLEKRKKRTLLKKKAHKKSLYLKKIEEYKSMQLKALKGLQELENQYKDLFKEESLQNITKEKLQIEIDIKKTPTIKILK